jgi:glycerol-3-phosphate acyltransferase PlsX
MRTIAIDAMGGDHAPGPEVRGAVAAAASIGSRVQLIGDTARIAAELEAIDDDAAASVELVHASQVVTMEDHPVKAYRRKADSSLRVAIDRLKAGEVDAVVSAGNSGAILAHAQLILGKLAGVDRPGIVAVLPSPHHPVILCDAGANAQVKPATLAQFGVLGACFDRFLGTERPRVGVLSNGAESHKGTDLTRAAHAILEQVAAHPDAELEYVGYVEGNTALRGGVDVIATDGFTGNVALKVAEGVAEAVLKMVRDKLETSTRAKLGAALVKPALAELVQSIHPSETGGVPLLGVAGLVMISHGAADARAIENAVLAADRYLDRGLVDSLAAAVRRHAPLWEG